MSDDENRSGDGPAIACNLLGPELAGRKDAISRDLFAHVERVEELPDGFAYRFPAAEPWAAKVLDFVAVERRCCPFFTFEIVFEPHDGPLWLRLRGSAEVKAFVAAELAARDLHPVARPYGRAPKSAAGSVKSGSVHRSGGRRGGQTAPRSPDDRPGSPTSPETVGQPRGAVESGCRRGRRRARVAAG